MDESQVATRLARHLAENGIPALRFELGGHGESLEGGESASSDFRAAVETMTANGVDLLVLIGGSLAARAALGAATRLDHVHGVVLTRLATKVRGGRVSRVFGNRKLRALVGAGRRGGSGPEPFDWASQADPLVLSQLEALIARKVPTFMVSGAEDTDELRMRRLLANRFQDLDQTSLDMTSVPARTLKDFRSLAAQTQFIAVVENWVRRLPAEKP
jgi:hypothetical protein